ncbi:MAG: class I SAM-dependent methyltransferase [Gammaproteobacteria bacterium]
MHDEDTKSLGLGTVERRPGLGLQPANLNRGSEQVSPFDRWVLRKLIEAVGGLPYAVGLWNGEEIPAQRGNARNTVKVNSRRAFYRALANPNRYFGDDYCTGDIEIEGDIVTFFQDVYRVVELVQKRTALSQLFSWIDRLHAGTPARLRANIHYHYDLGNAFYELWLDREALQYTCAYFPQPDLTLEQAQVAKMHHICRKLRLKAGERVVEAGCGWGGLALFLARHYGVTVRAYNISREQVSYARERAQAAGLADRVEYIEDDYRNICGQYDVFVSIGMLEHVGPSQYHELGKVIDQCLADRGRGLIHNIGRNKPLVTTSWIERRIFPGSYPPTLREMMTVFEPFSFSVIDVENLRLHYAQTLEHWLSRYEDHVPEVQARYGHTFVRAWRLYLAGSIASFSTGWLQLYQVLFQRAQNNDVPWTRAYMYS